MPLANGGLPESSSLVLTTSEVASPLEAILDSIAIAPLPEAPKPTGGTSETLVPTGGADSVLDSSKPLGSDPDPIVDLGFSVQTVYPISTTPASGDTTKLETDTSKLELSISEAVATKTVLSESAGSTTEKFSEKSSSDPAKGEGSKALDTITGSETIALPDEKPLALPTEKTTSWVESLGGAIAPATPIFDTEIDTEISADSTIESTTKSAETPAETSTETVGAPETKPLATSTAEKSSLETDLIAEPAIKTLGGETSLTATPDKTSADKASLDKASPDKTSLDKTTSKKASLDKTAKEPIVDSSLDLPNSKVDDLPTAERFVPEDGIFVVSASGQVTIDILLDGGRYNKGELGIFSLKGMEEFDPNSVLFHAEVAKRVLSESLDGYVVFSDATDKARFSTDFGYEGDYNEGIYRGARSFEMRAGDTFAMVLVPNASFVKLLANPGASGEVRPLYSIATANPGDFFQMGTIVRTFADRNAYAMEDLSLAGKSDRDYNDIVFRIEGAVGLVSTLDSDLRNPNLPDWRNLEVGQQILDLITPPDAAPVVLPVPSSGAIADLLAKPDWIAPEVVVFPSDIVLSGSSAWETLDLGQVFYDATDPQLSYDVQAAFPEIVSAELADRVLTVQPGRDTGSTEVWLRATDKAGNTTVTPITVTYINPETIGEMNTAVAQLLPIFRGLDATSSESWFEAFANPEFLEAVNTLQEVAEFLPNPRSILLNPSQLEQFGLSAEDIDRVRESLNDPAVGQLFGLPGSFIETYSNLDGRQLDAFLVNGEDAAALVQGSARPLVGVIEPQRDSHSQQVVSTLKSLDPAAQTTLLTVGGRGNASGTWADRLTEFVDRLKTSGQSHGIVNLSADASQLDDVGITTRYELTVAEQQALAYARDNGVLVVVAAGNTGGKMSALGAASQKFNNVITVGAIDAFEQRADYSGMGDGLSLVAPGGRWEDDPKAFVGTSRSTAYVSAAASLIWAANPSLSFIQVRQLLLESASDLALPGWDAQTGAGLLNVKEALSRARLLEGIPADPGAAINLQPFSGEGRSLARLRAAGEETQAASDRLQALADRLWENWQTLAEAGNPDLALGDLAAQVSQALAQAAADYSQAEAAALTSQADYQQRSEALGLALAHYQIEAKRLQAALDQEQRLLTQKAQLAEYKTDLLAEQARVLKEIQDGIDRFTTDLAKAEQKLTQPFATADDAVARADAATVGAAADKERDRGITTVIEAATSRDILHGANVFREEAERDRQAASQLSAQAASIITFRWQVVGTQRNRSGRTREIWGWGIDAASLSRQQQLNAQAEILNRNALLLDKLADQALVQAEGLDRYEDFLSDPAGTVTISEGDAAAAMSEAEQLAEVQTLLAFLKAQAEKQEAMAQGYLQEVAIAEERRKTQQDLASYHQSMANRWEIVGYNRGRSGRQGSPVYGWVRYPQHDAPAADAAARAQEASDDRAAYSQLAQTALQQAALFQEQARKLEERLRDWPTLKQGIEHEIAALKQGLEAERDRQALHTPDYEQQLERLDLQIQQNQTRLTEVQTQDIPSIQSLRDAAQARLEASQADWQAARDRQTAARNALQLAFETKGFLLPLRERQEQVQNRLLELAREDLKAQVTIANLQRDRNPAQPDPELDRQLQNWQDYRESLAQEKTWLQLQQDSLALAIADSPERLDRAALQRDLATAPAVLPNPTDKIKTLQAYEANTGDLLAGLDNLSDRRDAARAEQAKTTAELAQLEADRLAASLAKTRLETETIPAKTAEIAASDRALAENAAAIDHQQTVLAEQSMQQIVWTADRPGLEAAVATAAAPLVELEAERDRDQADLEATQAAIQNHETEIANTNAQIAAANARAGQFEQERINQQNAADYWNSQIYVWGVVGYSGKKRDPYYGWIYNGQAVANRDAAQAAANQAAVNRDAASAEAAQLTAAWQPRSIVVNAELVDLRDQRDRQQTELTADNAAIAAQQAIVAAAQADLDDLDRQLADLATAITATTAERDRLVQQRTDLQGQRDRQAADLNQLNQAKAQLERDLSDYYRAIEIEKDYLAAVTDEGDRLQRRIDLLAQYGLLEERYRTEWANWQAASVSRETTVRDLLTVRQLGQGDRDAAAQLQAQLDLTKQKYQSVLAAEQARDEAKQAGELAMAQLASQELLKRVLAEREPTLKEAEQRHLNQANAHLQNVWSWQNGQYVYNAAEAALYRSNLEQASYYADLRNQLWKEGKLNDEAIVRFKEEITVQTRNFATAATQLMDLGGQSSVQISQTIQTEETTLAQIRDRLKPLELQEKGLLADLARHSETLAGTASRLRQTQDLKATALKQLINFGMLASESDVDFFAQQVEPQVMEAIAQAGLHKADLDNQLRAAEAQLAQWQADRAEAADPGSQTALDQAIAAQTATIAQLKELQAASALNQTELGDLLAAAKANLQPLRQKQELELRERLAEADRRAEALASQNAIETAFEQVKTEPSLASVLALRAETSRDLKDGVARWTEQFLETSDRTGRLGTNQQELSGATDELLAYLNDRLAEPMREYGLTAADLREAIATLNVVENQADSLDTMVDTTEDAIAMLRLRLRQDADLWTLIAPIAARYGAESEELKTYQAAVTAYQADLAAAGTDSAARQVIHDRFVQDQTAFLRDNATAIAFLETAIRNGDTFGPVSQQLLNNTTAQPVLDAEAIDGSEPLTTMVAKAKTTEESLRSQGLAALAQADWYERQAAIHWAHSRKAGPYWYEPRWVRKKKGGYWETVRHVDHHWITWNQYQNEFVPRLRAQGAALLAESERWRKVKERYEPLASQWQAADQAAQAAEPPIEAARDFFAELQAAHAEMPAAQAQLDGLETLLPIIQAQLATAQQEAAAQNAKTGAEWNQYESDAADYRAALAEALAARAELKEKAIAAQNDLAEQERWNEGQALGLATERDQAEVLRLELTALRDRLATDPPSDSRDSQIAQLNAALQNVTNKVTILTAQQTALSQQRSLLSAQNEAILAEQRLVDAYLADPTADHSALQAQVAATRAALAEAQRLADQAAQASQALTAPVETLKTQLLANNNEYLTAAREHQKVLRGLTEATRSSADYTADLAQKQAQVNDLELQILQRLNGAAGAAFQETKHLLEVAKNNNMATAAEISYRDYSDLASDRGNSCTGGSARPEDRALADRYYAEMLNYRELQRQAQAQADAQRQLRQAAETEIERLKASQATLKQQIEDLNAQLTASEADRDRLSQELAVLNASLAEIGRLREQTEQLFSNVAQMEQLNLTQAQLEQQFAQDREAELDAAIAQRQERDRLERARQRQEIQARIEQLQQLQAEEELRQHLNAARGEVGLGDLAGQIDPTAIATQLSGLLDGLQALEGDNPDLPADLKALLATARGEIHEALQGKEAAQIQENLLALLPGLVSQIEANKAEIAQLDEEEAADQQLLARAQNDLSGASQALLKSLARSRELDEARGVINPIYEAARTHLAYAEQAVEISNELADQSRAMLESILEQRAAERKARKKAFWQRVLGIVSQVMGILGAILSFTPLAPLGIALTAASVGISAIQSIMAGDWMGGLFSLAMGGINVLTAGLGNAITPALKVGLQALQSIASGAFNGARSIMSGQSIMGFLQILSGVAGAAATGLQSFMGQCATILEKSLSQVFNTLKSVPLQIYGGIKAIESGDWFSALGSLFNAAITLGGNFASVFNTTIAQVIGAVGDLGNTALAIGGAIKEGSIEGWLSGLGNLVDIWGDDIAALIGQISNDGSDVEVDGDSLSEEIEKCY